MNKVWVSVDAYGRTLRKLVDPLGNLWMPPRRPKRLPKQIQERSPEASWKQF